MWFHIKMITPVGFIWEKKKAYNNVVHTLHVPVSWAYYSSTSAFSSGIRRNLCRLINVQHSAVSGHSHYLNRNSLFMYTQLNTLSCTTLLKLKTDLCRKGEGGVSQVTGTGRNLDCRLLIDGRASIEIQNNKHNQCKNRNLLIYCSKVN